MTEKKKNAGRVALGGVLAALTIVTLFLATVIPGIELTLFAISSLFVALYLAETSLAAGFLFYAVTSVLAVLITPAKLSLIPYPLFFGLYPLFKPALDRIVLKPLALTAKLIVFNGIWLIGFWLLKQLVFGSIKLPAYPLYLLWAGSQLLFLLYDAILSRLIVFARQRIKGLGGSR